MILRLPTKFDHKKIKLQINRLNKGLLNVASFNLGEFNMQIVQTRNTFIFREFVFNNASGEETIGCKELEFLFCRTKILKLGPNFNLLRE